MEPITWKILRAIRYAIPCGSHLVTICRFSHRTRTAAYFCRCLCAAYTNTASDRRIFLVITTFRKWIFDFIGPICLSTSCYWTQSLYRTEQCTSIYILIYSQSTTLRPKWRVVKSRKFFPNHTITIQKSHSLFLASPNMSQRSLLAAGLASDFKYCSIHIIMFYIIQNQISNFLYSNKLYHLEPNQTIK